MSDSIKHECAVALLALRRDLGYYVRKYGTPYYGYKLLTLLLEKQHNRGQDGAGVACVDRTAGPGRPAYQRELSARKLPLEDLVERIGSRVRAGALSQETRDLEAARRELPFLGEVYLGHLRYGTFGHQGVQACHPFLRDSVCLNRVMLLAGNFNLTDTQDIFDELVATGHHPDNRQDGALILDCLGHHLEKALAEKGRRFFFMDDFGDVLRRTAAKFDGAFTFCGMDGEGNAFALRDNAGIRPAYCYFDDEIIVVASERPAIQTALNLSCAEVMELPPGQALLIDKKGDFKFQQCLPERELHRCVFERVYFSRGNDADIHRERRAMGRSLIPRVLEKAGHDWARTLFSYIPNTAQLAFHGMLEGLYERCMKESGTARNVRFGQIAVKDAKFRTFIADDAARREFSMHVYDVTYGLLRPAEDTLVVIDDSIVRGNTMRNEILPILDRLQPLKIVIASAAPPICYPDCYGIDMACLKDLVAFAAAVRLLKQKGHEQILFDCYLEAGRQLMHPHGGFTNCVKPIYDDCTFEELEDEIGAILRPKELKAELEVVFQSCADLRKCCPDHTGDWYFSGDYPTPGGYRVVNQALIDYMEHRNKRAY